MAETHTLEIIKPTPVTPPERTTMYNANQNSFGLTQMFHQKINTRPEITGMNEHQAEDTRLVFEPASLKVSVSRQDLPAEDIDKIGELAKEFHRNYTMQDLLANALHAARDAVEELAMLEPKIDTPNAPQEIAAKAEEILEDATNMSPKMLMEKQERLEERCNAINEQAHELGVVSFSKHNTWRHNVTPPKKPETLTS